MFFASHFERFLLRYDNDTDRFIKKPTALNKQKTKQKKLRCVRNVHMLARDVFDFAKWRC